jgi:predicted glycoside hydrolase/deacetylase ChbG (UPF0249 family)
MATGSHLVVNADDFGQSPAINRGVAVAHERGIVTSASLMVRWPSAVDAAAYAGAHRDLSLGLHIDLGEWRWRDGGWQPLYEAVALDDAAAVEKEIARQLATYRRLAGGNPTHVDSHQHVHLREPVRSILVAVAAELAIPLRQCGAVVRYCGDFYGQTAEGSPIAGGVSVSALLEILASIAPGVTELSCHPGMGDDLETMYRTEREEEVRTLCDPRVRTALVTLGVELRSFATAGSAASPGKMS